MRTEGAFIVVVLLVGYALYGGLALGVSSAGDEFTAGVLNESQRDRLVEWGANETGPAADGTGTAVPFRFREVGRSHGLTYGYAREFEANNEMVTNAGVYALDYDDDGWTDLLAVGGDRPVLFENREGEFVRSGLLPSLPDEAPVLGAHVYDHDGDSREDVLLLRRGAAPLLLVNTPGGFEPAPRAFERALEMPVGATSADVNGDGIRDVFVIQYNDWTDAVPAGMGTYTAPLDDDSGRANVLYLGAPDGTYTRANASAIRGTRWSLATSAADFNGDGHVDFHVANDFNHDIVYFGDGDGTFQRRVLPEATDRNAMSSEIWDVNRDGYRDVFVTNFYVPDVIAEKYNPVLKQHGDGNNLLLGGPNGSFRTAADEYGVYAGGWGWAAVAADFDNDGDRDLVHATRNWTLQDRDSPLSSAETRLATRRPFYRHTAVWERSDRFETLDGGAVGFREANDRGMARLDFDNDGDIDLAVATTNRYLLYENRGDDANEAIQIDVRRPNGAVAYGATVTVRTASSVQSRQVRPYTDFLSQDARRVHVGVGSADRVTVSIAWPDGSTTTVRGLATGHRYRATPTGVTATRALNGTAAPTP